MSSLLRSTDCHVGALARSGYDALFAPSGAFASTLTALLTIYVALMGYRLLLGRSQLNVSEMAIHAIKIGAVVALATQWGTYQTVVYRVLFDGPQQIGNAMLHSLSAQGAAYAGDVFVGLQRAFDCLTAFSPAAPPGTAAAAAPENLPGMSPATPAPGQRAAGPEFSNLLSKPAFDSLLLQGSAALLLISTLGLLLISKIVLAILLGLGPIFLTLLLFDVTRGLFEGWLRASLAFAFAPLSTTLTLSLGLALLTPSLGEIEVMRDTQTYTPGVAVGVLVLVVVLAGVSVGSAVAAAVIARGFKLPRPLTLGSGQGSAARQVVPADRPEPARAERVAAAVSQDRRDATALAQTSGSLSTSQDRRAVAAAPPGGARRDAVATEVRLGQAPRRNAQPRLGRGLRSDA